MSQGQGASKRVMMRGSKLSESEREPPMEIMLSSDTDEEAYQPHNKKHPPTQPRRISSANTPSTKVGAKQRAVAEKPVKKELYSSPSTSNSRSNARSLRYKKREKESSEENSPARPNRTRNAGVSYQDDRDFSESSASSEAFLYRHEPTRKRKRPQSLNLSKKSKKDTVEVASATDDQKVCLLCNRSEEDKVKYFRMETEPIGEQGGKTISAHYLCMFTASNLAQATTGDRDLVRNQVPGFVWGFSIKDLLAEKKRANKLKCKYCLKFGAAVGCDVKRCTMTYHYPCGVEHGCFFAFVGNFESYCPKHIPKNQFPRPSLKDIKDTCCVVCLDEPDMKDKMNSLVTQCCQHAMHRECIAKAAANAGKHYVKCPNCGATDQFRAFCNQVGIHVPNADATWMADEEAERVAEEASEGPPLLCVPKDSSLHEHSCKCPKGPAYDEDVAGREWNIERCGNGCGGLFHAGCMFKLDQHNYCMHCYEMAIKIGFGNSSSSSSSTSTSTSDQSRSSPEIEPPKVQARAPNRRNYRH